MRTRIVVALLSSAALLGFAVTLSGKTDLGPLPDNAKSEYLETLGCGVGMNLAGDRPSFNLTITVKARMTVPDGALLEAKFDNLADPQNPFTDAAVVDDSKPTGREIMLMSADNPEIRCGNYTVVVSVYRDAQSRELLGTHTQQIQSRVDSREWKSIEDWMDRLGGKEHHVCPVRP